VSPEAGVAITDLTLGRFYGVRSCIHGLDARTKLVVALLLMGVSVYTRTAASFVLLYAFLTLAVLLSRVPLRYTLRNLKFFVWLLVVAVLLNLVFTEGTPLVSYRALVITYEGATAAGVALARLVFVVMTASFLMLTTQPLDLTEGVSRLLGFLGRLRLPVRELSLMSALSLSYLPVIIDEVRDISVAQRSRGATFHGRGLSVLRSAVSLLVPVLLAALRRADRLALAMESRSFRTAGDRTSIGGTRIGLSDVLVIAFAFGLTCGALLLGR
jgi:energy-coupling factor transport system permease protein